MADPDLRELERRWAEGQGDLAVGEAYERALERTGADLGRRLHVRQQVLGRHIAEVGLGGVAPGPLPEVDPFAFSLAVPGEGAFEAWRHLRRRAEAMRAWPVMVGAPDALERMVERIADAPELTVPGVLARAATLTTIDPIAWERERLTHAVERARATGSPHVAFLERLLAFARGRRPSAGEGDDLADDVQPWTELSVPSHVRYDPDAAGGHVQEPHAQVVVVLLPTITPWHAAAYLRFGGFNACPPPHEHVAIHRHWFERWGAEPAAITTDVVEMHVTRPAATRAEALAIADEHLDCASEGETGRGRLAARLLGARVWHLWWD